MPLFSSPQRVAGRSPGWTVATLALSMLLSSMGTSIANVSLPTLAQVFDASFQTVQWVVLAYLLAITTLIVNVGRLGDSIGRGRLLRGGLALFTLSAVLCGAAPTLGWLIAARAFQGLGAAVMMALTMALVSDSVPKDRTGRAMGLLGTMSAVGTALGPSLGGLLIAGFGWPAVFWVNVPLGLITLFLAFRYLPDAADRQNDKMAGADKLGTLLLVVTLAAYALAMTVGHGRFDGQNLALLAAAAVGAGLFAVVEARAPSPLIQPAVLRDGGLVAGLAANAVVAAVMMATFVVGAFFLSHGLGLDAARVGLVMAVGPVISAISGVPAGRLVDRRGATAGMVTGLAMVAAGCAALAWLPLFFGVAGYVAAIAVLTPGYQLFQAANNTAVMTGVAAERKGVISGVLNLSRNLGLITGSCLMGAIFATATGQTDITAAAPQAIRAGQSMTFMVAAVLVAAALGGVIMSRLNLAGFQRKPLI